MGQQLEQAIKEERWAAAAVLLLVGAARALEHDQAVITLMKRRRQIRAQSRGSQELPEAIRTLASTAFIRAP